MKTLVGISLVLSLAACGSNGVSKTPADMAMVQSNADLAEQPGNPDLAPACVANPMTHVQILNACTNATPFDKTPFYPALAPNGQLPPLP